MSGRVYGKRLKRLRNFFHRPPTPASSLQFTGTLGTSEAANLEARVSISGAPQASQIGDPDNRSDSKFGDSASSVNTSAHAGSTPANAEATSVTVSGVEARQPATVPGSQCSSKPTYERPEDHGTTQLQPATQSMKYRISEELWNIAYDSLEKEEAELVQSYLKTLETVLRAENSEHDALENVDSIAAELKDKEKRQLYMRKLVMEGQKKISTSSKLSSRVSDVAQFVLAAKDMVDAAIQNIPQAALPWAGVCIGLQILLNPATATKSNMDGIVHVTARMKWYCALSEKLLDKDCIDKSLSSVQPELKDKIVALYKALLRYQMKSACSYYKNQVVVFARNLVDLDGWDDELKAVTAAEEDFKKDLDGYDQLHAKTALTEPVEHAEGMQGNLGDIRKAIHDFTTLQKSMLMDDIDKKCRLNLRVTDPRVDIRQLESKKDDLLDEAYRWILDTKQYAELTHWNEDQSSPAPCRVWWIKGNAGTGKTMLMIGIIRALENQQFILGPQPSYYFFQGTEKKTQGAISALRSLLWMMLNQQPELISHLRKKYNEANRYLFEDANAFYALSEVFENMLKDPDLSPIYLVVDALDECDRTQPGLDDLIKLISKSLTISNKVKWLVSSRPDIAISSKLGAQEIPVALVELNPKTLQSPFNAYIDHKLKSLPRSQGYTESTLAQISVEMHDRAMNTFLWAALVFKKLNSTNGVDAVRTIQKMPADLLALYQYMLTKVEAEDELAALASFPADLNPEWTIDKCSSFLTLDSGKVYPIHQSAKDFLFNEGASRIFPLGMRQGHHEIVSISLKILSETLRRDMYNLKAPGSSIEQVTVEDLAPLEAVRYFCVHWVDHLCDWMSGLMTEQEDLQDSGAVYTFLKGGHLYWLEALSIIRSISNGVTAMNKLETMAKDMRNDIGQQLADLVEDAWRFILSYKWIIERAPLQTCASVLTFSPVNSKVRQLFRAEEPTWITVKHDVEPNWGACLQTLWGHNSFVFAVAFSPDGKQLASGSSDNDLKLWDVNSGICLLTFNGHNGTVHSAAFSTDGKILVSGSSDETVKLWDVANGVCFKTLQVHNEVLVVTVSPNNKLIAAGLDDNTIEIRDIASGDHTLLLKGHSTSIILVTFSPDGKQLASVSKDNTINLWDSALGICTSTLRGIDHVSDYTATHWSDGKLLALVEGYNIKVWDVASAKCTQTVKSSGPVQSVLLSQDSRYLATLQNDSDIRIYDISSGKEQILQGHSSWITSIAFSPTEKLLASASDDTIKLWNTSLAPYTQASEGHRYKVISIAISPGSKYLASVSRDHTLKLWEFASGKCVLTSRSFFSAIFSQDGQKLVLVPGDKIVDLTIWDLILKKSVYVLKGEHDHSVLSLVIFSPSSKQVAVAKGNLVALSDTNSGTCMCTLRGHVDSVCSLAYSRDGRQLASASDSGAIKIWDTSSGTCSQAIENHGKEVAFTPSLDLSPFMPNRRDDGIAFSPDGKKLASISGVIVHLWDSTSGEWIQKFELSEPAHSVVYSPDGKQLAVVIGPLPSLFDTVTLLDIALRRHTQITGVGMRSSRLAFDGTDNSRLLTGAGCITIPTVTSESADLADTQQHLHAQHLGFGFSMDRCWITCNGQNVLWLPPEYRPGNEDFSHTGAAAVSGRSIGIGCASGRVLFMSFSSDQ